MTMKTTIFKSLLLLFISMASHFAFSQTTFRYSYDIGAFDISGGMVETPAGEFVFAGINNSFGPYYGDVVKTDATGTVVWAKTYTGGFATNFSDIKNVSTGGYIVTGSSTSGGGGAILVRIDALGAVIWAKRYQLPNIGVGNASNEFGSSVIETSDGGFLIGGGVDYFWDGASASTVDTTSAIAFKVNSAGTLIWNRTWTITNPTKVDEHYINDVAESADGYFFVGESADETQAYDSDGDLPRNALIIKTDKATGALTYIRRWGAGNTTSQGINSAKTLTTGNILLGGYDDLHGFLVSISGVGAGTPAVIFNRRLNGSIFGNTYLLQDIMENSDGNYSTIGTQLNILAFPIALNTMIVKLNSTTGALMFGRTYAPIGLSAILPEGGLCADQGYHIVMTDQQAGGFNANMIRTDPTGQLGAGPAGCASTNLSPALGTESVTFSTPVTAVYTSLTESTFVPVVNNVVPARVTHCLNVPCVAPTPSNAGTNQTVCGTTASLLGNTPTTGTGLWTLVSGAGTITTPTSPTSGVTGLGVGPNVFQWTISNAPCPASTSTVTITGVATPTTSNAGTNQTVCGTTASLLGNTPTTGTGLWTLVSGAGTITTPSSPTSGVTGLGAGPTVFQWTISNAPCTASSSTVTITGVTTPTTSNAGSNQSICGTSASLTGNTPTSGTGTWTLVSGAGTITTPSSPSSGVTGLGVGPNVFQWSITNAPCTASTSTVTITGVAAPTASNAGANQTVCGTAASLNGNAPTSGTGTWTLVSGTGTITTPSSPTSGVTGLGAGPTVFQWTISNAPCTASSSTVTITGVTTPTTSNAGSNQSICGTSASLTGNTPTSGTGTWTLVSGAGTITTPSSPSSGVTGLGVGPNVFQWSITNAPCPASTSTVTITGVSAPTTAAAGPNQTLCSTSAAFAGNPPSSGTGTWTLVSGAGTITTPGSPTSTVTGLGVGPNVFQWTISNAPCTASSSTVTITNTGGPTTSAAGANQSVCGTTATLNGNTPTTGTGLWTLVSGAGTITSPTSPSSGVTGLGVGPNVFMWTISNPPCTPSTSTVTITGVTAPTTANAGTNQTICSSGATLAGNAPASGTGIWTLVSGTGTITTPSSPTSTVTGLGVGANVFMWTIDNAPCVASTSSITITNTGGPAVAVTSQIDALCFGGASGTASANASSGSGPYDYVWTSSTGTIQTTLNSSIPDSVSGLTSGTYTITITDNSGCTTSSIVTISEPATAVSVSLTSSTPSGCASSTGTATVTASGGTVGSGYTYNWAPSGGTAATASSLGAGTYTVTTTDGNGCTSTTSVVIGTAGGPTASIASQTNVNCNGGSTGTATASGSGGTGSLTYSWSGGAGTAATASGLASGTYTVIVTDGAGCTSTSIATITQPTAVSGIVNTTTATCGLTDGTATASATGGTGSSYTYLWSPGSATTSTITGIAAGTYTVTITDSLGCTQTATGTVGTAGSPPVDAGTTTTIVSGGSTVLVGTAGAGATYSWTPPGSLSCDTCASPIASPTTTTTYTLTITLNGCTSTDTVTVFVEEECGELFVPNVFSPNGDGNNDVLQVYGNCILDFEFAIFDRWGQKVFEITDPALTWDGRFNGKMMDAAVFVYYLKGTVKGIDISKHGNITLVK